MKKNYQILLCEDFYDASTETFIDKRVCEIASSKSSFSGQAYNIEFYTKIDGTHELSFELPRYYLDEETGKKVSNELVELLVNKCKLELLLEGKSFFFVINERKDEHGDGVFSYSYSCTDAYIEELSKNGYGLVFSDEVEGNGLGTIHQLAAEVVKDTDWEYKEENTGTLYEYTTELSYNVDQMRYDKIYKPVPVHPIKYIPEVERYCYELEVFTKGEDGYRKIYCYDDTEQITSNTVKNIIYNGNDFTDTTGWQSFVLKGDKIEPGLLVETNRVASTNADNSYDYLMKITKNDTITTSYVMNETAADANQYLTTETPYIFRVNVRQGSGKINELRVYNKNPLLYPDTINTPDYKFAPSGGFSSGVYYVIKFRSSFSHPYFVFNVNCANGSLDIESFDFFPVKGKATKTGATVEVTAEENNLKLLANLYNGISINENSTIPNTEIKYLSIMQLPEDIINSYTHKYTLYFTRDNYFFSAPAQENQITAEEDTLTYLDFATEVNSSNNYIISNGEFVSYQEKTVQEVDNLTDEIQEAGKSQIYLLSSDKRYYQYYELEREGVIGGKWDYALFGDGANDKRRTLSAERSNRFNLIQELAELFKVWPVFNVYRDESSKLHKEFWFRESCIRENFSGFHRGVNLSKLSRSMVSDEVVTKMYVEDQESDYAEDGFVTIRTSSLNPWGENYYYNFQYYVDQHLLNTMYDEQTLLIDKEVDELYTAVKGINTQIFELNDKMIEAKNELSDLNANLISLSTCIAAANGRITSLNTDIENYLYEGEDTPPDVKNMQNNLTREEENRKKYQTQLDETQAIYDSLKAEYDTDAETVKNLQSQKEELIYKFERKYAQYIKEGVWSDSSYVDNDTYYIDSLKVMNTSSMPKADWSISVIDGSVFKELEDFQVQVGDQTILVDNEFFGVQYNPEENYVFEILISGIKECLDEPINNSIEVRNYLTSFEDLFQRIAAATQTLTLNEQTYDKAAYFTADGQVDQDILQKTFEQNAFIIANAKDGNYVFDTKTGISCHSLLNSQKKLRLLAEGIFISNENGLDGKPIWKTGITADGINASLLTTGEVDTSVIKIFSRGEPTFSWNVLGISAYKIDEQSNKVDANSFVRLDQYGLYSIDGVISEEKFNYDGNGKPWFNELSRKNALDKILANSTFSLTNRGFNLNVGGSGKGSIKLGYATDNTSNLYGLYIRDTSEKTVVQLQNNGDNVIADWHINPKKLFTGGIINGEDTGLLPICIQSPTSSNSTVFAVGGQRNHSNYQYWNSDNEKDKNNAMFYVRADGFLFARNADIKGKISVGEGGTIAGFTVNGKILQSLNGNKTVGLASSGGTAFWAGSEDKANAPFRVTHEGKLTAKKAEIHGTIYADKGSFTKDVTIAGEPVYSYPRLASLLKKDNDVACYVNGGRIGGWYATPTTLANEDESVVLSTDGVIFSADFPLGGTKNYFSRIALATTKISVPINRVPSSPGEHINLLYKEVDCTCLTFRTVNGALGTISLPGNLYYMGGELLFNVGDDTYVINMTKL